MMSQQLLDLTKKEFRVWVNIYYVCFVRSCIVYVTSSEDVSSLDCKGKLNHKSVQRPDT